MEPSTEKMAARRRVALTVVSALAWGASHGVEARAPLAAVAIAALLIALASARRPFLLGWLFGTVAWCAAIPWIVPTLTTYGMLSGWLAAISLLLLAGFLGLYEGLFAWLGAKLWRRGDALSLLALPALWVTLEVARGWLFSGFPWNLAAYAWIDVPGVLPISSWIGAWGVSYLVVATNVGLAHAWRRKSWETAVATLLAVALVLALGARFTGAADPILRRAPHGAPLPVAVVQPNIPDRPLFDAAANEADYRRLVATSERACLPGALLLWPESAAWPRLWQDDVRLRLDLQRLAAERGCAILFNTAITAGDEVFNSVVLIDRAGSDAPAPEPWSAAVHAGTEGMRLQRADKRHLVPFGEYVPLRSVLPFLHQIARMAGEFTPASEIRLLDWRGEKLGAAVCYEVVFPGETAELVEQGATILVTVTNDGWYGDTAAPRQHLRAARFRAAENRRWLLRAAITGISAIVRPDGSLAAQAEVGEETVLVGAVFPATHRSPFTCAPWLLPALCAALACAGLLRARVRDRAGAALPAAPR